VVELRLSQANVRVLGKVLARRALPADEPAALPALAEGAFHCNPGPNYPDFMTSRVRATLAINCTPRRATKSSGIDIRRCSVRAGAESPTPAITSVHACDSCRRQTATVTEHDMTYAESDRPIEDRARHRFSSSACAARVTAVRSHARVDRTRDGHENQDNWTRIAVKKLPGLLAAGSASRLVRRKRALARTFQNRTLACDRRSSTTAARPAKRLNFHKSNWQSNDPTVPKGRTRLS